MNQSTKIIIERKLIAIVKHSKKIEVIADEIHELLEKDNDTVQKALVNAINKIPMM